MAKFIVPILAVAFFVEVGFCDDVSCRFLANQIVAVTQSEIDAVLHEEFVEQAKPFSDCWIYVFLKDEDTFRLVSRSEEPTDSMGGDEDLEFSEGEKYFVYFSGIELKEDSDEIMRLQENGSNLLVPMLVLEDQPLHSHFVVSQEDEQLVFKLKYSLPLWIAQLQKLQESVAPPIGEEEGDEEDPILEHKKNLVSQLRILFHDDVRWRGLITTEAEKPIEFDQDSGEITRGAEVARWFEALSYSYKRSEENRYELDENGKRKRVERFDLVTAPITSQVGGPLNTISFDISRVFVALDATIHPRSTGTVGTLVLNSAAAGTWARDLGLTCGLALEKAEGYPPEAYQWEEAVSFFSREYYLIGDIVGIAFADQIWAEMRGSEMDEEPILGKDLSSVFENFLLERNFWDNAKESFRSKIPVDKEPASSHPTWEYVSGAASFWIEDQWDRFADNRDSRNAALEKARLLLLNQIE